MKRKFIVSLLAMVLLNTCLVLISANDVVFDYDDSGNCVLKRKTIVLNRVNSNQSGDNEESETPEEFFNGTEVRILPNPTKGILKINLNGKIPEEKTHFKLISISGNVLHENCFDSSSHIINMTAYPSGIYILQLKQGENIKEWKIIKE